MLDSLFRFISDKNPTAMPTVTPMPSQRPTFAPTHPTQLPSHSPTPMPSAEFMVIGGFVSSFVCLIWDILTTDNYTL